MNPRLYFVALVAASTFACSHTPESPAQEDYLATNIRSDGSKEFYYTLTMSGGEKSQAGGKRRNVSGGMVVTGGSSSRTSASAGISSRGGRGGRNASGAGRFDEMVTESLKKKLKATGYCRDGWMEMDRNRQPPGVSIRGECNETATESDYREFPNTEDVIN